MMFEDSLDVFIMMQAIMFQKFKDSDFGSCEAWGQQSMVRREIGHAS